MHYVSLCAIIQNEEPYLWEWVRYHSFLGIDHIYLYENDSTDNTYALAKSLEPYVTVEQIHGKQQQGPAYLKCLKDHKADSRWIGFIDIDEFIVPKVNPLKSILSMYEVYSSVCFHWYLFGSNGLLHYDDRPVVERFTKREANVNPHVKSFVDPTRTLGIATAHKFRHHPFTASVDEKFKSIADTDSTPSGGTTSIIQVNHYCVKSLEESWERRARPGASRADVAEVRKMPEFFYAHDVNEVDDFLARDIWRSII